MPNYIRTQYPGGIYFFTLVTNQRIPILIDPVFNEILRNVIREARTKYPFQILAYCILPDHMHFLWKLPENDSNYSQRWQMIKGLSTIRHNQLYKTNRKRIWQNRFWEHLIRDEKDYENHFHYIHINPIKHGYVYKLIDWKFSSFQDYVDKGIYDIEYGFQVDCLKDDGNYGE